MQALEGTGAVGLGYVMRTKEIVLSDSEAASEIIIFKLEDGNWETK